MHVHEPRAQSAAAVAWLGCVSLASAMGIGRFAFTPLLPWMQQAGQVTLQQGGWLASANYGGYLVGALGLALVRAAPSSSIRVGLVAVAATTAAMAFAHTLVAWLALRFAAGIASAAVLVGVSTWSLPALAAQRRAPLAGIVFAGVGVGMALAGVVAMAAGLVGTSLRDAWLVLAALAVGASIASVRIVPVRATPATMQRNAGAMPSGVATRLVLCYGAFGFGYIIPATFVPALARQALPDPALFGWAWPLFGAAAALSTLAAARAMPRVAPVRLWMVGHLVMAAGVIAPVVSRSGAAIFVTAICVGSTFMVVTMAAIAHARELAGSASDRLVALMTAAFAFGQLVGPLTLRASAGDEALVVPSVVAASLLVASTLALARRTHPVRVVDRPRRTS